jgi:hypothetical protein
VWPDLPAATDSFLDEIARRLECGLPTDFHPVFGEVFELKMSFEETVKTT